MMIKYTPPKNFMKKNNDYIGKRNAYKASSGVIDTIRKASEELGKRLAELIMALIRGLKTGDFTVRPTELQYLEYWANKQEKQAEKDNEEAEKEKREEEDRKRVHALIAKEHSPEQEIMKANMAARKEQRRRDREEEMKATSEADKVFGPSTKINKEDYRPSAVFVDDTENYVPSGPKR
jgi:hypothetical protein